MKNRLLITAAFCAMSASTCWGHNKTRSCANLLTNGLDISDVFILVTQQKIQDKGYLPTAQTANARIQRAQVGEDFPQNFVSVLNDYGLTRDEWKLVEGIKFTNAVLGTEQFDDLLNKGQIGRTRLSKEQIAILKKLSSKAAEARAKLKTLLVAAERMSFEESKKLLSEEELIQKLHEFSQNAKLDLAYLGAKDLRDWRYKTLTENAAFRKEVERTLRDALLDAVSLLNEIPESSDVLTDKIAAHLDTTPQNISSILNESGIFKGMSAFVDEVASVRPNVFKKFIDKRVFTEERRQNMLDAMRDANDIIAFKLPENQDILTETFAVAKNLSKALGDAPIVVSPAFVEIGLIPEKLEWLFNEPNVHFMIDREIQLTRDFYISNHGFPDKTENPFTGLDQLYDPTDKMIEFSPVAAMETRATGNYDVRPGYFFSSGSISDPAYRSPFAAGEATDARAQRRAEKNISLTVLSRRFRNPKFANLLGSANGMAPRRARYTQPRYGNPAGLFDLKHIYTPEGARKIQAYPAIVLGDLHLGNTDPLFLKAVQDTLVYLEILEKNPAYGKGQMPATEYRQGPTGLGAIVIHDLIEGTPNNGHNFQNLLTRALEDEKGALDLRNHIQMAAAWLKQLCQLLPNTKIVIPVDNHGSDWLAKKLELAKLSEANRPKEIQLLLQLMLDVLKDKVDPYRRIFEYYGVDTDQVLFLTKADTYRAGIEQQSPTEFKLVHGVEIGQHSHMGKNGARAISLKGLFTGFGANATGHTHSTAERGQSAKAGTGTPPRQGWHRGPANSDASIILVYSDTAMQILRMEQGSFVPNAPNQAPEEFFPSPEYPRPILRKTPPGGTTTDQYRSNPPVDRHPR